MRPRHSSLEDCLVERILNNDCFLIIVPSRLQNEARMVIDQRGQICLDLFAAFTDWKFQAILDIALSKHHAVRFTKTSGSGIPGLCITLHLLDTKSRPVKVAL
jgi:hypothetical protein